MPVVIHDFEALPSPESRPDAGKSGASHVAMNAALARAQRELARRRARLRG